ncbi:hypothetical protein V865_007812 [Kwoniella europaea PYCC6329]|uniref:Uncharacterized protein n=1 Tax=Kwoniella europaea PYCC6329 TaxID=1423913 RepID=A0AAX4KUR2_9TREE
MATHLSLSSDESTSIGNPTREMSSKETTIYDDQFNNLVKTLTHDALINAKKNFLIRATETEESDVKDYLSCKITSNEPYRKYLESFLSNAFEGVNKHYGNDREEERIKALSNLDLSVDVSHSTGIRNINADSSKIYRDIYRSLDKGQSDITHISKQAFDGASWQTRVGQIPQTFPSPLTKAVEERGIPKVSERLFQDLSSKLQSYRNSSIQLPFRGLWSTKDWLKLTESMQPKVLDKLNSVLRGKWQVKTAKELTSNGSLLKLSVDLEVTPSELTSTGPGLGSEKERFGFNEDSIQFRIASDDGFFKEIDPPRSEKLSEFVDYNDPKYDVTAQSIKEHDEAERLKWR